MRKIIIPYTPRSYALKHIHPNLESHQYAVIVCHRRFGKTVLAINHMIKQAIICKKQMPRYAYIAPFKSQAKEVAWSYLKYYTHVIPNIIVNETELYVELPTKHSGMTGARIYIRGADKPDSLRGMYYDGVLLDEYAQIKPTLWDEVISPALLDRNGWAVFIGTPKGQNQFYDKWLDAQRKDNWYTCMVRWDESGLFAEGGEYGPDRIESIRQEMSAEAFRQEMECDFTASAFNVLIKIDDVTKSASRTYKAEDISMAPKILGVDVARFGNDRCVIFRRQGLVAFEPKIYSDIDNMTFAAHLMHEIDSWNPDAVFVDAGRGEGVIDRCRQMGYDITEVNFGAKSIYPEKYVNKRVEMWDAVAAWIKEGGAIPQNPELKSELTFPEYSFDSANRMKLMSKEEIKELTGKSPDIADALALTFAHPVRPKGFGRGGGRARCNTDYDLFD